MRRIVLSAAVATLAALSFAAPSQAGGFSIGFGFGNGWGHNGYVSVYEDYGHHCFWKKIKRYDKWGNLVVKRVRVCD